MVCVSTINVLGFFGSTFPNSLRAIPGLRSLVSFESITNCCTFPCGTPSTALRSAAGTYSGPITKLLSTSSGGFSPVFSTLKGGEPGSSNLRTGGAANKLEHARTVMKMTVHGLNIKPLVVSFNWWLLFTVLGRPHVESTGADKLVVGVCENAIVG